MEAHWHIAEGGIYMVIIILGGSVAKNFLLGGGGRGGVNLTKCRGGG